MPATEKAGATAVGAGDVVAGVDGNGAVRLLLTDTGGRSAVVLYDASGNALLTGDMNNVASAAGLLRALGIGRYDASLPTLTTGRFSAAQLTVNGAQLVTPVNSTNGAALFPTAGAAADGASNITATQVITQGQILSGSGTALWNRIRGNNQNVVLASQAATVATRTSSDLVLYNERGVRFHVNTSAKAGTTATYTPSVQVKSRTGNYKTVWTAAAPITDNGDYTYAIYPSAIVADSGGDTEVVALPLGPVYRFVLTVASADGSNSMTTVVDADHIL